METTNTTTSTMKIMSAPNNSAKSSHTKRKRADSTTSSTGRFESTSSTDSSIYHSQNSSTSRKKKTKGQYKLPSKKYNTGRWTDAENRAFLLAMKKHGAGNWTIISKSIPTRNSMQVKTHGQTVLKHMKRGDNIFELLDKSDNGNVDMNVSIGVDVSEHAEEQKNYNHDTKEDEYKNDEVDDDAFTNLDDANDDDDDSNDEGVNERLSLIGDNTSAITNISTGTGTLFATIDQRHSLTSLGQDIVAADADIIGFIPTLTPTTPRRSKYNEWGEFEGIGDIVDSTPISASTSSDGGSGANTISPTSFENDLTLAFINDTIFKQVSP